MIRRLFFMAALLAPGLTYGADPSAPLSVQVVPPGVAPPVPAAAQTAGFAALAFDGDFSKAFDVSCDGTGQHDWYVMTNGALAGSCSNLTWPYNDSGANSLHIKWTTSTHGSLFGRVGMTTVSNTGSFGHDFPI